MKALYFLPAHNNLPQKHPFFLQLDKDRTSIWEAVGLSETKTSLDQYDENSGIEENRPASTAAGSTFSAGGSDSSEETAHTAIDIGDSSFSSSIRHNQTYGQQQIYTGSVAIDTKKDGGYAVVPSSNNQGIGTATITHQSRYNTTFVNGKPIVRTYENTTIVKDSDGRILDTQKQYSSQNLGQAAGEGTVIHNEPYPVPIHTTARHFDWNGGAAGGDSSSGRTQWQQSENFAAGAGGESQRDSYNRSQWETSGNQYYDRYGHAASGYQNQYDREYHSRGQDLRDYGGDKRRFSQEQQSAGGAEYQQSGFEAAAAGKQFRTQVVDLGKLGTGA